MSPIAKELAMDTYEIFTILFVPATAVIGIVIIYFLNRK